MSLDLENLASLISKDTPLTVLTGAGMSTESGLPDFRSNTGLWRGKDPMKLASLQALKSDPRGFHEFYRLRLKGLGEAKPNRGHRALARMENLGLLRCVITQNIDGLHQEAGSRRVIELHGNLRGSRCLSCQEGYPLQAMLGNEEIPLCSTCGDVIRPNVVLFGEQLPGDAIDEAFMEAEAGGILLVLGSSLEVSPANFLPAAAKGAGASLAICNLTATHLDGQADFIFRKQCGLFLSELLELLDT